MPPRIAPAAVHLDVADDEDHDGVVGEHRPEAGEDVAQEREIGLAVVGVVERARRSSRASKPSSHVRSQL